MTMLPRTLAAVLATLALAAAPALASATADTSYGAGIKLTAATPIARILADPDAYVGKTVRIEGKVVDVCPMAGCWMELATEATGAKLRIKVDDGVMVFPATAKGRVAAAEGVVEAIPMSREEYTTWLAHLADEQGKPFDPKSVGKGPFRILQIRGTGARIAG
jgi:starvation-inducible outer membrane lipoprotein